jgi:hypothetical protein
MTTKYNLTRDVSGAYQFGLPISYDNFTALMATGVAQAFAVPATSPYFIAIIGYPVTKNLWIDNTTTAVVPSSSVARSSVVLNMREIYVKGGTTLSLITDDATGFPVSVSFYATNFYVN